jgi:hypothetical protein
MNNKNYRRRDNQRLQKEQIKPEKLCRDDIQNEPPGDKGCVKGQEAFDAHLFRNESRADRH